MAEPYSTVLDPTRSLDNVLRLGYNPEALGVLSGAPIRWGNQPSGISGGARDSGEHNILSIQNTLETAADPGPWETLKGYLRVPGTGDRIIPTAEDNLNMARMLGIPGTSDYGGGIAQQSARQILPVMEEMINRRRGYLNQPKTSPALQDTPEALFWTPPLEGPPVYPPSFRQETIDILEANPGLDSDMVRHYVRGKEIGEKLGPTLGSIGGYAKEALDWMWPGSRAGFSLDDLLASETGIRGKSVQEALDAGVFRHTEPSITGYGQGLWGDVSKKAETLDIDMSPAEMLKDFVDSPFLLQHEATGPSGLSMRGKINRYVEPKIGFPDFDLEMETAITPQTPEQYLRSIEDAGALGKDITPSFLGIPSRYHMPEYLGAAGPEPDTTDDPRVWHTEPAAEWTPPAPVIPDISDILKAYVPPPAAPEPYVEQFEEPEPPQIRKPTKVKKAKVKKAKPTRAQLKAKAVKERKPKKTAVQKAVAPKPKYTPPKLVGRHPTAPKVTPVARRKGGKPKVRRVSKAPRRPGGR